MIHETLGAPGGIRYTLPPSDAKSTYEPIFADVDIPSAHAQCALFALGDDEGSTQAMFERSPASGTVLAAAARFQAVLVVRPRLRFIFDASIPLASTRWLTMRAFHEKLFAAGTGAMLARFVLEGAAPFSRIAVLILPHYAFGEFSPQVNPVEALEGKPIHVTDPADVIFEIRHSTGAPIASPFLQSRLAPSEIRIEQSDLVFEPAMRYVLGVRPWKPGAAGKPMVDLTPLHPGDMQGLARLVERELGEPRGARHVGVF